MRQASRLSDSTSVGLQTSPRLNWCERSALRAGLPSSTWLMIGEAILERLRDRAADRIADLVDDLDARLVELEQARRQEAAAGGGPQHQAWLWACQRSASLD